MMAKARRRWGRDDAIVQSEVWTALVEHEEGPDSLHQLTLAAIIRVYVFAVLPSFVILILLVQISGTRTGHE